MNNGFKILVVDDDTAMQSLLSFRLESLGYQVQSCDSAEQAKQMLETDFNHDLVISDVMLPGMSGTDLLKLIKQEHSDVQVIIMTAYPSLKLGVDAIKSGAFDFICKPFDIEQLLKLVKNALENQALKKENLVLRQSLQRPTGVSDLIGQSPRMKEVRQAIRQSSSSRATVLITGASGTGKEVVARTIHKNSPVHQGLFVDVNCGAIPENLVESELFGYEKGAFTGALKQTKGKFEQAQNGTIFLDELGELPLQAQVKLLRVLQEKEITRLGGGETIKLNVRVIAATNRNLQDAIREGRFREDLYYRIALFLIDLPKLEDRGKDIVLLAEHFLEKYTTLESVPPKTLDDSAKNFLVKTPWPGNVRQLENSMYRTVLMQEDKTVLTDKDIQMLPVANQSVGGNTRQMFDGEILPIHVLEAQAIREALIITRGNVKEASSKLELSRVTLYRKMKEYNLDKFGSEE
ncbi:MAG: sigma-54-dependent Fis family transcriptional regulator [SAR324 cluster bacterium]|nr:sigma-54-dependent Fis family transcriptional regulator [SAR324 cluster bacterium]